MQTIHLKASDIPTGPLFIKDEDTDMDRDGFVQYNVRDEIKVFANNEEIICVQRIEDVSGWALTTIHYDTIELLDDGTTVKVEVYS